jgi:hypothetical protein
VNQALIVVTSYVDKKRGRIYHGLEEWCDGWRFPDKKLALRKRSDTSVSFPPNVQALVQDGGSEDKIIWMRGADESTFPVGDLTKMIDELSKTHEVYLAHHDEFVGGKVPSPSREHLRRIDTYTLSRANKEAFKEVIRDQESRAHLDPMADFDKLFNAFFLVPADAFGYVEHKLPNLLGPLDMYFQRLAETSFSDRSWKAITEKYPGESGKEVLSSCKRLVYDHRTGLTRLYEEEKKAEDKRVQAGAERSELRTCWERVIALLPDDEPPPPLGQPATGGEPAPPCTVEHPQVPPDGLYLLVWHALDALGKKDKESLRTIFSAPASRGNPFQLWYGNLDQALKELGTVVMREHTRTTVGA